jgi:FkbM family methyltransferase
MSRIDRALGLARSVAMYHAIPWRRRRMRQLYGGFVSRGDVVFDIGAHAGNRARAFAQLGCRVIAVEPQPDFAALLRRLFRGSGRVDVLELAVSDEAGLAELSISERTPTVTTIARTWRDRRAVEPDFAGVRWNRRVQVETTTLDRLIDEHGVPAFVKIDVEGAEPAVLGGLSRPVRALSFEYLPRAADQVEACLAQLARLGRYGFNWSAGESYLLESSAWMTGENLLRDLRSPRGQAKSGDVYARLLS